LIVKNDLEGIVGRRGGDLCEILAAGSEENHENFPSG
jgi:hypothetical protein